MLKWPTLRSEDWLLACRFVNMKLNSSNDRRRVALADGVIRSNTGHIPERVRFTRDAAVAQPCAERAAILARLARGGLWARRPPATASSGLGPDALALGGALRPAPSTVTNSYTLPPFTTSPPPL